MAIDEKAIFVAALALTDANERDAYLEQACAGDPALLNRVKQLLSAHEESQGPLDRRTPPLAVAVDQPPGECPGTVIGPYKLLEQIGEGGMGTVWMAQQAEPVKRLVALKLIKAGMDTRQLIARFEAERQALALMDHANIARVLDAGTTERGRPYFVMDLVKGVPITKYCDEQHLTPRQRLELFIPVCQAIQHAHQKGIIHRDLKPSNVLVALYDGKPVPKVIDFGVAKAIGQPLTEQTLVTGFGAIIGTLEYMSPEQAEINQLDIDTRSDIYSLGVLLYELLTGTTPLERKRVQGSGLVEALRIIREEEVPTLSQRLSSTAELPAIAANRGMEPAKLTRLVRGELDWIVMKCLEKDRHRRYESASAFAADVQRYLADEPVQACPPSAGYRLRKFVRRHRGPVLAASLVLLVLLAGIVGTTWGMLEARHRAEGERLAKLDAQTARQKEAERLAQVQKANDILLSIFRNLDPRDEEKQGRPLRAILGDRLDKAAAELEGEAVGDPLTGARLQNNLGLTLSGLGHYKKAIPLLEKSRRTRESLLGADHPDTSKSMHNLADAYRHNGQLKEAVTLCEEILARTKARLGPDHPDTLHDMNSLAVAYWQTGQLDKAIPLFEETLAKQKAIVGPNDIEILRTMNNLAVAYDSAGRLDKAVPLLEEALAKHKERLGPDHADTLHAMHNLAMSYYRAGRRDEALLLFEETLAKRQAVLGPDHPDTLMSLNALGGAYLGTGRLPQALPLLEQTLAQRKAKLGPDHQFTLNTMSNLAGAYADLGQFDKAVPLYEEALAKRKAKLGPDHPDTLSSMTNLAVTNRDAGRLGEALPLFEDSLAKHQAKLGPDHPDTLVTMNNLALLHQAAGRLDQALPLFEETLVKQKAKLGPDHPDTLATTDNLASAYLQNKQPEKALPILRDSLAIREKKQPDSWTTFATKSLLGGTLLGQKNYSEAEPLLLQGYEGMKQREGKIPAASKARLTEALERLVALYDAWGKKAEADKWRKELEALKTKKN